MQVRITLFAAALLAAVPAQAQLLVSTNDGKQVAPGETDAVRSHDNVVVLRADSAGVLRTLGEVRVPTSMIGPPRAILISPDKRYAVVTASQRLTASQPATLEPDDSVSVIDLSTPAAPKLVETVHAGAGVSGIAISPSGRLVMVANAGADSVSLFRFVGGKLTRLRDIGFAKGSKPVSIDFAPGGRSAWVVLQVAGKVKKLDVRGEDVTIAPTVIEPGSGTYSVAIGRDGRHLYTTNLQGNSRAPGSDTPSVGTVAVIDLSTGAVTARVEVGNTPEHVVLSPDGKYAAVVLINGSNAAPDARNYKDFGLLKVFSVKGGGLEPVAETRTGRWCQGAEWNATAKRIYLQCASDRIIHSFAFDGTALTPVAGADIKLESRPGAIYAAR